MHELKKIISPNAYTEGHFMLGGCSFLAQVNVLGSFGEIKIETIEIIIVKINWFWKNLKKNVCDF